MYYKKAVLKSFKNFTEKNLCITLFLNKIAGWNFFIKGAPVEVFFCKFCQIFQSTFFVKHIRVTASAKYPFVCHVSFSHKTLPLTWFFPFYFKYLQSKYFSFLKALGNYDWTDLLLTKQVIHWKCYRKSELVAQQWSVKMMFCILHNFHRKASLMESLLEKL